MRRAAIVLGVFLWPSVLAAQALVVSPRPDKVAVTVYRDPNGSGPMRLGWLQGFALVSETRRVSLPAGEVDLRFEGVAGGLIPQSAVVSGLGDSVSEKNRDARLLSPGTLLDSYLGRRVNLRRTSKATGQVVDQEAVVRATSEGIVVQGESGIEALRCTGLNETTIVPAVPADLSAKPTLSVRARAERAVEAEVTLTYLTSDFDWRAHYVATLAPDGRTMALFAWLTLANGDESGFANADTMAVAGRLNREYAARLQPDSRPISLQCWPSGTTSDSDPEGASGDMMYPPPPPPSPPPAMAALRGESIVVTGSRIIAQREDLGDLKLYRIPIPVTVAANSQKQVALIEQPRAMVETLYRWNASFDSGSYDPRPAQRVLTFENRTRDGLGLPLPSGTFTLYTMREGRPFLLGEGRMSDRAVGESVDVPLSDSPGVRVLQRPLTKVGEHAFQFELTATNDQPFPVRFQARFRDGGVVTSSSTKLVTRDGYRVWEVDLPASGSRTLTIRYRNP